MRTETVTRTIYSYAELLDSEQVSERAKEKAKDWLREVCWEPSMVTESIQEVAEEVLGDSACVQIRGWDADRGQKVDFDVEFRTPLPDSGWEHAPTLDLDGEYRVFVTDSVRRNYGWPFAVCYLDEDGVLQSAWPDEDKGMESIYEKVGDFLRELESFLVGIAVSEIEWLNSDENIADFAEANEFEFDEHGERV